MSYIIVLNEGRFVLLQFFSLTLKCSGFFRTHNKQMERKFVSWHFQSKLQWYLTFDNVMMQTLWVHSFEGLDLLDFILHIDLKHRLVILQFNFICFSEVFLLFWRKRLRKKVRLEKPAEAHKRWLVKLTNNLFNIYL